MMPIGGLCFCLFVGWVMERTAVGRELGGESPTRLAVCAMSCIRVMVRYVAPLCLIGVFFYQLLAV